MEIYPRLRFKVRGAKGMGFEGVSLYTGMYKREEQASRGLVKIIVGVVLMEIFSILTPQVGGIRGRGNREEEKGKKE